MQRKAFVTGAGGFIGGHLVKRLIKDGWQVVATDRLELDSWLMVDRGSVLLPDVELNGVHPAHTTTTSFISWAYLLKNGPYTIFHCAAQPRIQPSFEDPYYSVTNNIGVTAAMLEGARFTGCRVVYAGSSTAAYGPLLSPYAFTKHVGEDLCRLYRRHYGLKAAIARFYNVYGPLQVEEGPNSTVIGVWGKALREGKKLPIVGDGLHRRAFTHIDDVIDGMVLLADQDRDEAFNFGYSRNYSIKEAALLFVDGDEDRLEYTPMRLGEPSFTLPPDPELGWEAKISLEEYAASVTGKKWETVQDSRTRGQYEQDKRRKDVIGK